MQDITKNEPETTVVSDDLLVRELAEIGLFGKPATWPARRVWERQSDGFVILAEVPGSGAARMVGEPIEIETIKGQAAAILAAAGNPGMPRVVVDFALAIAALASGRLKSPQERTV